MREPAHTHPLSPSCKQCQLHACGLLASRGRCRQPTECTAGTKQLYQVSQMGHVLGCACPSPVRLRCYTMSWRGVRDDSIHVNVGAGIRLRRPVNCCGAGLLGQDEVGGGATGARCCGSLQGRTKHVCVCIQALRITARLRAMLCTLACSSGLELARCRAHDVKCPLALCATQMPCSIGHQPDPAGGRQL